MNAVREEFGYVAQDGSCWQVVFDPALTGSVLCSDGWAPSPWFATDGNFTMRDKLRSWLLESVERFARERPQGTCQDCGRLLRGPFKYCNTDCEARDRGII